MKLRGLCWLLVACVSALFLTTGCTPDDDDGDGSGGVVVSLDGGADASRTDGGGSSSEAGTGSSYTVGGLLTGLATGGTVVLQDNGGDTLTLTANGAFTFATPLTNGSAYAVTVLTQPSAPAQTCALTGATGTVFGGSVGTVEVVCSTPSFTLGGTVSGLQGSGLALTDGNGDELAVTGNGMFVFGRPLASGTAFIVSVKTQPIGPVQTCRVAAGAGTIGSGKVTSVNVNCDADKFTISGTVTGLAGTGLVLQNNGGDDLSVTSGSFAFATTVASGQMYNVKVLTQPAGPTQSCLVTGGTGAIAAADISNVVVTCTTTSFTIGGTLSGLAAGDSVVLQDNGGDNLTLSANGAFTFATPVASGATYTVTAVGMAATGPIAQTCSIGVGTGSAKVGAANVTSVTVSCAGMPFTVGGTISGLLTGQSVVLQDNGGDNLTVSKNGGFTFATSVPAGGAYAVSTLTQPSSGTCHLFERTGSVASGPVTTVTAICGIDYFVNAATGSDVAAGTSATTAWKTITHAIAALPAPTGGTINVAPGTYNAANGEVFPLEPRANQSFIGDPAYDGIGPTGSTIITGLPTTSYAPGGEIGALYTLEPVIAIPPGVTGVSLRGFDVVGTSSNGVGDGIVVDGATATLANDTVSGAADLSISDLNGGKLTLLDCDIEDGLNLLVADATTTLKARRNTFAGVADNYVVQIGYTTAALVGTNVDLGTASDPGGNIILGAPTGLGLYIKTATTGVRAAGNTWRASVQGASASGTYTAMLASGPVASAGGNNYEIDTTGSIQF